MGEVLSTTREDLVLASDLMADRLDKSYLRVAKPKTGKRVGGSQQQVAITDPALNQACEHVFRQLERSEQLFPFSGQAFRRGGMSF